MNWIVAALAVVTALDVPQRSRQLREATARERLVVALGLILAAMALAGAATPLLDALDISAPTMEVGAGLVLVIYSILAMVRWDDSPAPDAVAGGLVPLLFPIVLTPAVGVVLLAVSSRNGLAVTLTATVVAAAAITGPMVGRAIGRPPARMLSGAVGIVIGVVMIVDGALAV